MMLCRSLLGLVGWSLLKTWRPKALMSFSRKVVLCLFVHLGFQIVLWALKSPAGMQLSSARMSSHSAFLAGLRFHTLPRP